LFALAPWLANDLYKLPALRNLLWIASASLLVSAVALPMAASLQGFQKIGLMNLRSVATSLIGAGMVVPLVALFGLAGVSAALTANSIVALGASWRLSSKFLRVKGVTMRMRPDRYWTPRILRYSLPSLGASLVVSPAIVATSSLVVVYFGFPALGMFSVASSLAEYLLFLPAPISVPTLQ